MAHPQEDAQLLRKCDASGVALGDVLEQSYDGKVESLGYFSKALQALYSTYDLELLGVYLSVQHFEHFLLDKHFHNLHRSQKA